MRCVCVCVFFGQVLRYVGVVDVLKGSARVELRSYERGSALGGLSYNDNLISISSDRYSPQPLVIQVCVRARRRRACVRLFCARVSSSGCVSEPHTPSLPPSPSLPPPHSLPHTHAGPGSRLGAHGVGRLCGPAAPQPRLRMRRPGPSRDPARAYPRPGPRGGGGRPSRHFTRQSLLRLGPGGRRRCVRDSEGDL